MPTLTIDGTARCNVSPGDFSGSTTSTVTITTTKAKTLINVVSALEVTSSPHATVISVAATGLVFAKRGPGLYLDNVSGTSGTTWNTLEVWSAQAASPGTYVITVTVSRAGDTGGAAAFGVNYDGVSYPVWSSNASLPKTATNSVSSNAPTVTAVATDNDALLLGFVMNADSIAQAPASGFTLIPTPVQYLNGAHATSIAYEQKALTGAQTGLTVSFGTAWHTWSLIADAIEAPKTFSPVAHAGAACSGGGIINATTIDTTGANLIVLAVMGAAISDTPTDNVGNTYTLAQFEEALGRASVHVWYCINPTLSAAHQFSLAGVEDINAYSVSAWSGAARAVFDQLNFSVLEGDGTILTQSTGSITPTQDGELCLAFYGIDDPVDTGSPQFTIDSGFTLLDQTDVIPGALYGGVSAYLIQTTAGTINPTLTRSDAQLADRSSAAVVVSFKFVTFPTTTGKGSGFNGAGLSSCQAILSGTAAIGDFLIVAGVFDATSTSIVSISNGLGDTATFDIRPTGDALGTVQHFAAHIPSLAHATTTVTVTFTGGTLPQFVGFGVWTGNGYMLTFDKSSYATGTGTTPDSGTTATLDNADDVAVALAWSGTQVFSIDPPWVDDGHDSIDNWYGHRTLTADTGISATFTATDNPHGALVLAYKSSGSVFDTFNRADGALGPNWSNISLVGFSGNPQIISNQVGMTVGVNQSIACWTADSFANDQWCELSVQALAAYAGLAVRCDVLSGSAYGAYLSPNGSNTDMTFLVWTNGAFLNLAPQTVLTRLLLPSDIVRLEVAGQTITMKINGATVFTLDDATLTSGSPGIAFYNTDARADNFKAGPVVAPPPPLPHGLYFSDGTQAVLPSGVLKLERTQPWSCLANITIIHRDLDQGSIVFSNVLNAPYTGYEIWIHPGGTVRVRIMHDFSANQMIEVDGPTLVADGNTHMIAASYDGSSTGAGVKIYVDGVAETTATNVDLLSDTIVTGAGDMWIGNQFYSLPFTPPFGLQGVMNFFAFSNAVRDAAYMSAHASLATKPAVDANTTLYYDFSEGSGTTLTDQSANGYNATISGTGYFWTVSNYTLAADKGSFALTGQAAITRYGRVVKAVKGTLALTGQATGLRYGRVTTAAKGTFTLNGRAAILRFGHVVKAAPGAFTLSGKAATLRRANVLPAIKGTFTLTGNAAGLIYSGTARILTASTGTFALSGQAATLRYGRKVAAAAGVFALAGQAATLRHARVCSAATGAVTLSGQAAALRYARKVAAAKGTFALAGQAAFLRYTRVALTADKGTFTLTGSAAGLIYSTARVLPASTGTFALSGQAATLRYGREPVVAATGVFALTGQPATLRSGRVTTAAKGTFALAGQAASLRHGYVVPAAKATFTLAGQAATLRYSRVGVAGKGAFLLNGAPVNLIYSANQNVKLSAATGSFTLGGQAAILRYGHAVTAAQGTFALSGKAATLRYARKPKAECGVFVLHGRWADLIYSAAPPFVPSEDRTAFTLEDAQRLGITVADESRLAFTVQ